MKNPSVDVIDLYKRGVSMVDISARVAHHFQLQPGYVVHHEDQDRSNDSLDNLRVFVSQSEHLKYHHGQPIKPIWDGRICRCDACKVLNDSLMN